MAKAIEVRWHRGQFAGTTDTFPIDEFKVEVQGVKRAHLIRGPKGGKYTAWYRLHVKGLTARIDYRAFAELNQRHDIELGLMEFRFASVLRNRVNQLLWKNRVVRKAEATVITVNAASATSIADLVTSARQTLARQRLRPGQAQFRRALDLAYGGRCCVSGCSIPWALDAAHIRPYTDKQSNAVTNGLLLRSDLHSLFDAGQLAVDPRSRMVHFTDEARSWKPYGRMHAIQKLRPPQAGYENCAPKGINFVARWKAFRREHPGS